MSPFTDITERRRLEQSLRRVNQHLEQFAYAAAHDMREPLRTIALYAQLLQRHQKPEPGTPTDVAINHILTHAYRMETLVSDLLAFARAVEPEISRSTHGDTDPHSVIAEVLSGLSRAVQEAAAEIHVSPELPVIDMQPVHLRQVVQNLLTNAIKYRAKERRLEIRITADSAAEQTTFCVADNGIGFQPEYHDRIFGIFKRLHGYEVEGNGIGLALCRKIVEDYGAGSGSSQSRIKEPDSTSLYRDAHRFESPAGTCQAIHQDD